MEEAMYPSSIMAHTGSHEAHPGHSLLLPRPPNPEIRKGCQLSGALSTYH